ncbi:YciI family protein [Pelagibacterium sp.]|uniref:YciI family protein n=1 Tax=Pelagibacterium sp. TaxID=1967288 RepID=UPI003BA979A2
MKYLTMVTTTNAAEIGQPPAELMMAIGKLAQEAGPRLIDNGGMARMGLGAIKKGKLKVDGPFTETKEVVAGFAIHELGSEAEAITWVRKFLELHETHWPQWEGEVELLEIMSMG